VLIDKKLKHLALDLLQVIASSEHDGGPAHEPRLPLAGHPLYGDAMRSMVAATGRAEMFASENAGRGPHGLEGATGAQPARRRARQADAPGVDLEHLHAITPFLELVLTRSTRSLGDLRDVHQAVAGREDSHESAESIRRATLPSYT